MKNPYEVLGLSKNASREEVDNAYRNLAGKYNPDHYAGGPLEGDAKEKMEELNAAYDKIVTGKSGPEVVTAVGSESYTNSDYKNIRDLINRGDFEQAKEILNSMPMDRVNNPEWDFLYGTALNATGFNDQAYIFFERAYNKEPANPEYSAVYNRLHTQKQGQVNSNPYPEINVSQRRGCSSCDLCFNLIALDCCCECMGGDLIACC